MGIAEVLITEMAYVVILQAHQSLSMAAMKLIIIEEKDQSLSRGFEKETLTSEIRKKYERKVEILL
jgi:hypothetical protein